MRDRTPMVGQRTSIPLMTPTGTTPVKSSSMPSSAMNGERKVVNAPIGTSHATMMLDSKKESGGGVGIKLSPRNGMKKRMGGGGAIGLSSGYGMSSKTADFDGVSTHIVAGIGVVFGVIVLLAAMLQEGAGVIVLCSLICFGALGASYYLTKIVMAKNSGTLEMQGVVIAIRQGAEGFFRTQYTTIAKMTAAVSVLLFAGYLFRPMNEAQSHISSFTMAIVTSFCFVFGAFCSAIAGFVGLYVCVRANARVAGAARKSFQEAMQVSLLSGAIPALLVIALVVIGILFLYVILTVVVVGPSQAALNPSEVPLLLVGYGFGASFVALFAQLGGGIYTKAADVGADLVGKGEFDLDEDDPRNPAVVADLVGDNVGDCAGRGADLFESIAAEIVSAMILGGTMAQQAGLPSIGFVMFPVLIHGFDLVVSSVGIFVAYNLPASVYRRREPLLVLKCGYYAAVLCSTVTFYVACSWLLHVPGTAASGYFFCCGLLGMGAATLIVLITQYYTDYTHHPVQSIAKASMSGHATNIIAGTAVGMESTVLPTLVVMTALLGSFYLGEASGLVHELSGKPIGGLFGTAVATMGMLSSACFVLTMDFFGPISDNAGGIVEMASEPEDVREVTDLLDAVGNTTKAATKGFAVGSASLACFLLFSAFMDEVELFTGEEFKVVDIAVPEVFVGGALGAALVMLFSSWTLLAVGRSAEQLVEEVRRQFKAEPGILKGTHKPNYTQCVALANRAALREMIRPGVLAVFAPMLVGFVFKQLGVIRGDVLLGPKAVAGMLMFATVVGVNLSLYMNNAGGAWDNAKKLIETGKYGGKNSEAHKATVTGDTVGDPFKDTAGPSLHVLIKLLATITLVMAPLFVPSNAGSGPASGSFGGDAPGSSNVTDPSQYVLAAFVLICIAGCAVFVVPKVMRKRRKHAKRANKRALV
eukprot:g1717.t1